MLLIEVLPHQRGSYFLTTLLMTIVSHGTTHYPVKIGNQNVASRISMI